MAPIISRSEGHDWGAPLLDPLGIFYIVLAVLYVLTVFAGLGLLFVHREKAAVRIRSFWLTAIAVILLLIYGAWVLIVYPLNGLFTCDTEFWVMSVFLPTSIALFQGMVVDLLDHWELAKHSNQRAIFGCYLTMMLSSSLPTAIRCLRKHSNMPNVARVSESVYDR